MAEQTQVAHCAANSVDPPASGADDILKLLVTACDHARRDMQIIIPIVESGAGMSASSLRNTLGLINKALVAAGKAKHQETT